MSNTTEPIRFSVIVPMYNVEAYIVECMESILNQTYSHFQLIVVDDQSTDSSLQKFHELHDRHADIVLLEQRNSGPNVARNLALDHATGDYVLFVDADDAIEPDTLERLSAVIAREQPDFINFGFDYIDSETRKIRKRSYFTNSVLEDEAILSDSLKGTNIVGVCWNKCIRCLMIKKNGLRFIADRQHGRDILFSRQCAQVARKAVIIKDVLYHSRFRRQSFSRSFSQSNIDSAIDLAHKHLLVFQAITSPAMRSLLDYAIGRQMRYILILSAFRSSCFADFADNIKRIQSSLFWRHTINDLPGLDGLLRAKDRLLSMLLKNTYLCWLVARVLLKFNYEPY
jgi:glycosyltransferase involved in cell wall biosynthesis